MGLLPEFSIKYINVGSGSIIGKDNIEEFLITLIVFMI